MSFDQLKPGVRHTQTILVDQRLTVPAVAEAFTGFAEMPAVFATAFLVGFVEWTCIEALRPYLSPEQRTVGVHVDLSHSAATPVGMRMTADVELISVADRKLRFKVACRDDAEPICEGFHERFVVDRREVHGAMSRENAANPPDLAHKGKDVRRIDGRPVPMLVDAGPKSVGENAHLDVRKHGSNGTRSATSSAWCPT